MLLSRGGIFPFIIIAIVLFIVLLYVEVRTLLLICISYSKSAFSCFLGFFFFYGCSLQYYIVKKYSF